LDGRLNPSDAARLEGRLSSEATLKATLEELRQTRGLLRRLPQRRAPRNFRLTAKMAGVRPPEPRAYPVFRFATALAALLLVASVALNAFTPFAASRLAAAPAPALGLGGGGGYGGGPIGGGDGTVEAPPAPTELAPFAAAPAMPTATAEGTLAIEAATSVPPAEDTARAQATEQAFAEQANKSAPAESQPAAPATPRPIPLSWIVVLAVVMLVSAVAAWLLRTNNERRIRERWKQK
jgi:hypothetical protein